MNRRIFADLLNNAHAASAVAVGHRRQLEHHMDFVAYQAGGVGVRVAGCVEEAQA